MTWRISKTFEFAAAHHLPLLADGHKCRRPHGHNYTVTLELEAATLDRHGFVLDYGDLAPVADWIKAEVDHRDLNDLMEFQPTAEHLARWVFERWCPMFEQLVSVTVTETGHTTATYTP